MTPTDPPLWQKVVGIILALTSGCLIGASVVFTKKGLISSRSNEPGREHAYLKNFMWWIGMVLTGLGELSNFGAYAFAPAILVTPLGALSVVISAVLSTVFLKERLNFPAKIGCAQCIIGAIIIVLHAPESSSTQTVPEFYSYLLSPVFLVYTVLAMTLLATLIFYLAPRYASKSPLIYISISSIIGAYLVLSCSGFGSALVYSIRNWQTDNQLVKWETYPILAFITLTIVLQVHFLNRGLAIFSAAVVTPIYYVFFTTATLVTSAVLFRGFPVDSASQGLSIVMGFMVIVGGVGLLFQYSMQILAAGTTGNCTGNHAQEETVDVPTEPEKDGVGNRVTSSTTIPVVRSSSMASFDAANNTTTTDPSLPRPPYTGTLHSPATLPTTVHSRHLQQARYFSHTFDSSGPYRRPHRQRAPEEDDHHGSRYPQNFASFRSYETEMDACSVDAASLATVPGLSIFTASGSSANIAGLAVCTPTNNRGRSFSLSFGGGGGPASAPPIDQPKLCGRACKHDQQPPTLQCPDSDADRIHTQVDGPRGPSSFTLPDLIRSLSGGHGATCRSKPLAKLSLPPLPSTASSGPSTATDPAMMPPLPLKSESVILAVVETRTMESPDASFVTGIESPQFPSMQQVRHHAGGGEPSLLVPQNEIRNSVSSGTLVEKKVVKEDDEVEFLRST
ncbi:hypothetical protein HDU97_001912 [Phlyctochytrium planicorne]|nr:hypothetical protein HDU97_001912 [Phlyctochytrium planicorne]